jgi:hypothetical protein
MTDIYLFGAGASAAEGAPATSDLLPEAWRLCRGRPDPATLRIWRFLSAVWGQPISTPADFAHLPHIDEVVSLIDWSLQMEQGLGPDYGLRELWGLRQDLTYLIEQTLGAAMARGLPAPGGPHERFVGGLVSPFGEKPPFGDKVRPVVLFSLNYDTLLDRALKGAGLEPDYGFGRLDLGERRSNLPTGAPSPSPAPNTIPLLKLHGSLNWARCPACDHVEVLAHPLDPQTGSPSCSRCGCPSLDRLIISPTWLKRYTATQLRHVWDLALEALQFAESLTFIGYSLPPNDVAVAQFLRRALLLRPAGRPLAIRVLNHSQPGTAEAQHQRRRALAERFIRHFGPTVTFNWDGFRGRIDPSAFRPFRLPV